MNLANEGLEARKKDEEIANRKRKVQEDKVWEGTLYSLLSILIKCPDSLSTLRF